MVKTLRKCSESSEFAGLAYIRRTPPLTTFLKTQLLVTKLYKYALSQGAWEISSNILRPSLAVDCTQLLQKFCKSEGRLNVIVTTFIAPNFAFCPEFSQKFCVKNPKIAAWLLRKDCTRAPLLITKINDTCFNYTPFRWRKAS